MGSVKAKLRAYGKTGPLGSIRKHEIVNVEELFNLLNMGNSPLAEMWKVDNSLRNRGNWRPSAILTGDVSLFVQSKWNLGAPPGFFLDQEKVCA